MSGTPGWRLLQSRDRGLQGSTHCGYCAHGSHLLPMDHDRRHAITPGDTTRLSQRDDRVSGKVVRSRIAPAAFRSALRVPSSHAVRTISMRDTEVTYNRERIGAAAKLGVISSLFGAVGVAAAIGVTFGASAVFHWSHLQEAIAWVAICLAVVGLVLAVTVSRARRLRRQFDRADAADPVSRDGR
jgi:Flp pilus assembly protein TadB